MSMPALGVLLGGLLGLLDGLSALMHPEAAAMIVPIVVGSTLKGLITGIAMGLLARRLRSIAVGVIGGLGLGLALSYLAALTPDPHGQHHYLEIMLPGAILGVIVGFATQRFGTPADTAARRQGVLILIVALASGDVRAQPPKPAPDRFRDVRFLVGRWSGSSEGQAGRGSVVRTYEPVLNERFLYERNRSEYPAQAANPKGEIHEHWSFLSYDKIRQTVVLRQFHVEGFVNTYRLTVRPASKVLVFESEQIENLPGEWKARETYEQLSDDEFTETFELAPPGKSFETYGKTRFRRVP